MVKIQLDLDDNENRFVGVYKELHGFVTKADAIKDILTKLAKGQRYLKK